MYRSVARISLFGIVPNQPEFAGLKPDQKSG